MYIVGMFGAIVVLHYASLVVFEAAGYTAAIKMTTSLFNVLFPVISGMLGAAAGYYFSRSR
jgi:uncharacterized membrane protein